MDLQKELTGATSDVKWDVRGILHTDGTTTPLPSESRGGKIFQSMVERKIRNWAQGRQIKMEKHSVYGRGYPGMSLEIGGKLVAVDVKSARAKNGDRISTMTLGTYNGHFLHPEERRLRGRTRRYGDYSQHWVVAVIYGWHPERRTEDMVDTASVCVGQKWQFAGRTSGSGDTANIGGQNSLSRLKNSVGVFADNAEFERYRRDYAVMHPRKRTRAP